MGCSSFPWDAGDPPGDEDVAAGASRDIIHTMIIMRHKSGRESHVFGVAADQTSCRDDDDDKMMVVLLVVSAVCCERVESNECPWRVSEAGGLTREIYRRGKRGLCFFLGRVALV